MNSFENSILILSHPDDEVIFATSLLDKISTLIICFNDIPKNLKISIGRKRALNNYPIEDLKVFNLDSSQSFESFLPLNWLNIKDKKTGLKGGYQKRIYDNNYYKILDKLSKLIPKKSQIITHNPWGEYGHSEHCQVFKACFQISLEKKSNLFVTGYISNLSKNYALRKLYLLFPEIYQFKTSQIYFSLLKKHYLKYGCWTWYHNYELPKYEFFYKIDSTSDTNSQYTENNKIDFSLNYIHHKNPLSYYIQRIIKNLLPIFMVDFLRNKYIFKK